ncbi:MAG TPA: TetR/AcrR family transcriptional regulator [Gemmatimonadaceae bacterium]|jgi:AcrR family transcriptional regulator|nr:TetR/AcrR family transcriptional regulator [Gemmatimonadaceae bacterium]
MTASPSHQEPRWRRLPEERPRQILEAAREVFGEHGLAAARLDDIAKRAGLSKGTIYLYFPNKEELFREMVRQMVVSQIEQGEQELSAMNESATEVLTQFLRSYWRFIRSPQFAPLFRLIHAEIHSFPDLARFYAEEVISRVHRLIAAIITRGIETGEFRPLDARVAARMMTGPFVMHGLWCTHRECFTSVAKGSDEQVFGELMQFTLNAIRAHP